MKKWLLLMLACCAMQPCIGQKIRFTDTGNRWEMVVAGDFVTGTRASAGYAGDTEIAGRGYHRLVTNGGTAVLNDTIAVREDSIQGKIYFRFVTPQYTFLPSGDTAEHLLFDYSLRAGDTLKIAWSFYTFLHIVKGLDSVRLGTQYCKHWHIAVEPEGAYEFIEGMGTNQTPVNIIYSGLLVDRNYQMRCFSNRGISLPCAPAIHVPFGNRLPSLPGGITLVDSFDNRLSCNYSRVTAVGALPKNAVPGVMPNPGGSALKLHIPATIRAKSCSITNALGQQIISIRCIGNENISIAQYLSTPGVYSYTLQDAATGQRYTGRFVFAP